MNFSTSLLKSFIIMNFNWLRDHPLRLRDRPGLVQGWESVCWGVLGIPLLENQKIQICFMFYLLIVLIFYDFICSLYFIFTFIGRFVFRFLFSNMSVHEFSKNIKKQIMDVINFKTCQKISISGIIKGPRVHTLLIFGSSKDDPKSIAICREVKICHFWKNYAPPKKQKTLKQQEHQNHRLICLPYF